MSTLTSSQRGWLPLLLLAGLLGVIVWASLPKPGPIPPNYISSAPASSSPAPPPPPDWHWGSHRNYKRCPGTALEHIVCRHGSRSKYEVSKFDTNSDQAIKKMILKAIRKGQLFRDGDSWKVVYDFGRNIGRTAKGEFAQKIEIILSDLGEILTAYPI